MKSVQITRTEIEITKKELADFVAAHLKDAVAEDATVVAGAGPASPSKSLGVVLGLTRERVDGYLRPLIPTLPPIGSYRVQIVNDPARPDVAAVVMWRHTAV
jgi:hypothetical protein